MTPTTQAVDTAFTEKPNLKASIHEAICTLNYELDYPALARS